MHREISYKWTTPLGNYDWNRRPGISPHGLTYAETQVGRPQFS